MNRGKSRKKLSYSQQTRDDYSIASPRLRVAFPRIHSPLSVTDLRTFHPSPRVYRPYYAAFDYRPAKVVTRDDGRSFFSFDPLRRYKEAFKTIEAFSDPKRVWICVRRKARREVLHALKLTRMAGSGGGKAVWTERSNISC